MLYPKSKVPTVFVIGATGYIGGAALAALKKAYPQFCYSALVRSEEDIAIIQAAGVSVVLGSTEDHKLITEIAASHDIAISAANAADLGLAKAALEGVKIRAVSGARTRPIFLHTSNTGITTNALRTTGGEPGRDVDLEVLGAGESGQIATYVIAPSTVYGIAHNNPKKKYPHKFLRSFGLQRVVEWLIPAKELTVCTSMTSRSSTCSPLAMPSSKERILRRLPTNSPIISPVRRTHSLGAISHVMSERSGKPAGQ